MMRRIALVVAIGMAMVLSSIALVACGGGISGSEDPELRVGSTEIELSSMAPNEDRTAVQDGVVVENTGPGELSIESIEWVEKPTRVEAYHQGPIYDESQTCVDDSECGGDGICLRAGGESGTCYDSGFADFPQTVRSNASFTQNLVITRSEETIDCPDAPNSDAPNNYCGELLVKTNAPNDTDTGEEGEATVYLVSDGTSGLLALNDTFLQFIFAAPEMTRTQTFEIENEAPSPLHLNRINFATNPDWFSVSPAFEGTTVPGNQSMEFTIELTPPAGATTEDLNFQSGVTFETSAVVGEPAMTVRVTDGPGPVPISEVDPQMLSFADGVEQTLEVRNYGETTLSLHQMRIDPQPVREFYTVTYDGVDVIDDSTGLPNVAPIDANDPEAGPTVEEFTVHFTPPADAGVSTVGELRINHNDSFESNRSFVTLLGDATEVAAGVISPKESRFRSDGGEQIRYLAINNGGNSDLEITGVDLSAHAGTSPDLEDYEFPELEAGLTIGPGEIANVQAIYTGSNALSQGVRVEIESNHAGQAENMIFNVTAEDASESTMDLELVPSFPAEAIVDQATSFQILDSTGQAKLSEARWYTHGRPAGSQVAVEGAGEEVVFWPDVAGTYHISTVVEDQAGRQVQVMLEFEAVAE